MKVAKKPNSFKYFTYGILGLIVVLVGLIIFLKDPLPKVLQEENLKNYPVTLKNGTYEGNDYIVYLYAPDCVNCTNLAKSEQFKAFEANPAVRYYKVNVGLEDNVKMDEFIQGLGEVRTPTLYYIQKNGNSYNLVKKILGNTPEALQFLSEHTK